MAKKKKPTNKKITEKATAKSPFSGVGVYWTILTFLLISTVYTLSTLEPANGLRAICLSALILTFLGYQYFYKKNTILLKSKLSIWFFGLLAGGWLWGVIVSLNAINVPEAFITVGQDLSIAIFILLVVGVFQKTTKYLPLVIKAMVLIGMFHASIGIAQYFEIGYEEMSNSFPFGFAFNRTFYGPFMAMLFPFALALLFTGNNRWRAIGGFALIVEILAILLSQCRSAWVGIALLILVANVLIFTLRSEFLKKQLRIWWGLNLGGLLALVLAFTLVTQFNIGGKTIQSTASRISSLFEGGEAINSASSTINERILLWGHSLEMMQDHPVMGVGQGNWKLAAPLYINDIPPVSYGDYFLLRPHNSWLQIGVERGIPGLLILLSIWSILFYMAYKIIRGATSFRQRISYMALLGCLLVFAVDMVFGFPHIQVGQNTLLAIATGLVIASYDRLDINSMGVSSPFKLPKLLFIGLAILLVANTYHAVENFRFQKIWKKAFDEAATNNLLTTIDLATKAKKYWQNLGPNSDPVEVLSSLVYQNNQQLEKALEEIKLAEIHHPNNYRVLNAKGTIYTQMENYVEAEKVYLDCIKLTPNYRALLKNLALNYFKQSDFQNCLQTISKMEIRGDEQLVYMQQESIRLLEK
ncbi:MAG: O-antigen ligase [Polaribacter sp.]|jgi:O-antigen ligase